MIPVKTCLHRPQGLSRGSLFCHHKTLEERKTREATHLIILPVLEIVQNDVQALTLNTIILDHNTSTANDFAGVTLTVNLAKSSPGTENLCVLDLDKRDFVFGAKSLDEFEVLGFGTRFDQDTKVGLTFVEGFGAFTESTGEAVVNECVFQNLLLNKSA